MKHTAPPSREINEANVSAEQQASQKNARFSSTDEHSGRPPGLEAPTGKRPQTPDGYGSPEAALLNRPDRRLPRSRRIRKRSEYLQLQRSGHRRTSRSFVVITRPRPAGESRLGITASRRVGGAVVRNRVKRLVREFFRLNYEALRSTSDVLIIARPNAAALSYDELGNELSGALRIDARSRD
jgi:ribonuclease P protein component